MVVHRLVVKGKAVGSGESKKPGAVTQAGDARGDQGGKESSPQGQSGKRNLWVSLRWAKAGAVSGTWRDPGIGAPGHWVARNDAPGRLSLDRRKMGVIAIEGGMPMPKAMSFSLKSESAPTSSKKIAMSLKVFVEVVSFTKSEGE